ncbi:stress-induced hydrophobic peptide [Hibiscus syriacus]|uniref:Stress-induced hydrophobic peptide n=1 Tax=Hibiscus syriacus TaxID=106335 RepID=A0A6A3BI89_HIBSY|nr:stress-induced hydrophobic peptide [Hibiscus syriacus]
MVFDVIHEKEEQMWAVRLLSIACLSLAAKMEECEVPILSEFDTKDYQFQSKVIQRMELLVLSSLEWKMNPITPFSYLHYFVRKFHAESNPKGLISKALELIISITKEINLVDYRPSIVAAAAVLAASNSELTRKALEVKIDFISLWDLQKIKMVEIEKRKCKTPKFVITSKYSSIHTIVVEGISDVSHGGGTKRKLIFNESDQNSLAKKICRP